MVLGVSKDSVASHEKFKHKYKINFPLLSDPGAKVIEKYGAWQKKKLYGREFMGIVRSTFLIDEKGIIAEVWPKVKPAEHALEVLETLRR